MLFLITLVAIAALTAVGVLLSALVVAVVLGALALLDHLRARHHRKDSWMNQTLSRSLLAAGVAWFLYQFGELLTEHSSWAYLATTAGAGEILKLGGSVVLALLGALGTTLPRPDSSALSSVTKIGPALLLAVALGGAVVTLPACASHTAPVLTPSQRAAAILQRIDELQNAVISANTLTPGSIPDAVAVPLVQFCVDTAKVLRASPDGVLPAVAAAWQSAKLQVPIRYRQLPAVAAAFIAVDIAFAEFGAPPAPDPLGARIAQHLHAIGFAVAAVGAVAVCAVSGGCWGS